MTQDCGEAGPDEGRCGNLQCSQNDEAVYAAIESNYGGTAEADWRKAILAYGIVNACTWFGHAPDSEFTQETIAQFR